MTTTSATWKVERYDTLQTGEKVAVVSSDMSLMVAECGVVSAQHESNARLIAAAPEMLALLREMHDAAQSVPILKEPPWNVGDVANALPMMKAIGKLRALLAQIDGGT